MSLFFLLSIGMAMGILGEVSCKYASSSDGLKMYAYMTCAALSWGSGALTWTMIYRLKSITEIMVLYNPIYLLILATAGVFLFREPMSWRLVVSIMLLCICFMLQK